MTIHAFKDAADGYYEVDVKAGDPLPEWTGKLTSCAVAPAVAYRPTYAELRAEAYPPIADFADATVKRHSTDPAIVAEGVAQEAAWAAACIAVKAQYPKP